MLGHIAAAASCFYEKFLNLFGFSAYLIILHLPIHTNRSCFSIVPSFFQTFVMIFNDFFVKVLKVISMKALMQKI